MAKKDFILETLYLALDQALADLHTACVAKVTKVNATTVDCRPVVARVVDGATIMLPEFIEVPPIFMQGGGSYTAHPIAVGDYCLLIIAERCFDRWYDGADDQPPLELRLHDYSDAFALVGINPLAAAIPIPSVIQQSGDANFDGNHTQKGNMDRTGDLTQTGDVDITGNVEATSFTVDGVPGITGTFFNSVTVVDGIVVGGS